MEIRETRSVSDVRAERAFQSEFKNKVRHDGIHKAVDWMEGKNKTLDESKRRGLETAMLGKASHYFVGGLTGIRPNRRAGRCTEIREYEQGGVKGLLTLEYYDGELQGHNFTPYNA